jgi:hypothetical protein
MVERIRGRKGEWGGQFKPEMGEGVPSINGYNKRKKGIFQ